MTLYTHTRPCHVSSSNCLGERLPGDDVSVLSSNFECSICLELSQDPVVTMCGHLFCWSCLHQWITIHSTVQECPVCKAYVKDKIIPLYGRGKVGVADPKTKTVHQFDMPRPPPVQQNYAATARVPSSPRFQNHSFISHENYVSRGGQTTYSAASFGLFPALFGFYMITLPDYSSGFSSGTTQSASFRLPAIGRMTSQQQRLNAQQEFVLYWFLILLACFAILCFLLF